MDAHIQYANFSDAAREGNTNVLRRCTRKDTNKLDSDGMSPLHWAALYGKIEALKVLIGKGGNPDRLNSMGSSALHLAAGAGRLHCLVFLTNYGCNVYAINDNGATPMQEAVNNGRLDCVRHIEALVTHQVSQDKAKVEKMQITARKEAERRIKEKNKLLLKMDRSADKKSKQRKLVSILNSGLGDEFPTTSTKSVHPQQPFSQLTRFPPPSEVESFEHESRLSMPDDATSDASFKRENDSDISFSRDKPGRSDQILETNEASKPDKNIPHPSKSPSLMASLRSLHSNDGFISSGTFTNISLQGCQGPLLAMKNGKVVNSSFDESANTGIQQQQQQQQQQQPIRTVTIGNVPPSKRIGEPVGLVDISMGPLYTFLHSLQLDEFRELFLREKIDLRACLLCNENDLREIGLPVGPRKKFLEATSKRNRILKSSTNELIDSAV